jgi:excisionase family DNA binding protein
MDAKIEPVLITPIAVAELIQVSRAKVYELIASGALPSVRLEGGRLIRVPMSAIRKLAASALTAHAQE